VEPVPCWGQQQRQDSVSCVEEASFEGAVSTTVLHTVKIRMLILKIEGEIILVCPPKKDRGNFKHI